MLIAKGLKSFLSYIFKYIKVAREIISHYQQYAYQIERVDLSSQIVILRSRVTRTILKTSFKAAIGNPEIIFRLPPIHACLLGGYYGRALGMMQVKKKAMTKAKGLTFLLSNKPSKYRIILQERDGSIRYINKNTAEEFVEDPIRLARNKSIISEFDSSQACYIGILAGMSIEKRQSIVQEVTHNAVSSSENVIKLYLVK